MKQKTSANTKRAIADAQRQMKNAGAAHAAWAQTERWHLALTMDCASGINRQRAEQAAQVFWQRVDCELYGAGQVKRQGKRLKRMCYWHGDATQARNWHLHSVVQLDIQDADWRQDAVLEQLATQFGERLAWHWRKLREAGYFCKIELINSEAGWTNYIRKEEHYSGDSFGAKISTKQA